MSKWGQRGEKKKTQNKNKNKNKNVHIHVKGCNLFALLSERDFSIKRINHFFVMNNKLVELFMMGFQVSQKANFF